MMIGIENTGEERTLDYRVVEQKSDGSSILITQTFSTPLMIIAGRIKDYIGKRREEIVLFSNWDWEIDKRGVIESRLHKLRRELIYRGVNARVI